MLRQWSCNTVLTVLLMFSSFTIESAQGLATRKLDPIVWVQPPSFKDETEQRIRPEFSDEVTLQDEASASSFAQFREKVREMTSFRPPPPKQKPVNLVYAIIRDSYVIDPLTNSICTALEDMRDPKASLLLVQDKDDTNDEKDVVQSELYDVERDLIVVMSQLGDLDSLEYGELLRSVLPDLEAANMKLRIIGIGNAKSAQMFSIATDIPLHHIRVDPEALIHKRLGCHRGPNWDIPFWVPNDFIDWFAESVVGPNSNLPKNNPSFARDVTRAWMNHMAMTMGIGSKGTMKEMWRGIVGDRTAPKRLSPTSVVHAGPIVLQGMDKVKLGKLKLANADKNNNKNYYLNGRSSTPMNSNNSNSNSQRPMELAAVRLRSANELSLKYKDYVADPRFIDRCGATFIFENGQMQYEHRNKGILMYSETMSQPLLFLEPYIGQQRARDPLSLSSSPTMPSSVEDPLGLAQPVYSYEVYPTKTG